jgi:nucleoside-diphosphate-sugar epimerase
VRVLVAGAHGKTARRLVRMLAEDGHEVRGLVRKEEQTGDVEADGAESVVVDLEAEEVAGGIGSAIEGCDAVVFAAGAGPGSGAARKETRWTTAGPPSWSRPRRIVGCAAT